MRSPMLRELQTLWWSKKADGASGAGVAARLEAAAPMPQHGRFEPFTLQLPRELSPPRRAAAHTPGGCQAAGASANMSPVQGPPAARAAPPPTTFLITPHALAAQLPAPQRLKGGATPAGGAAARSAPRPPLGRTPQPAFGSPVRLAPRPSASDSQFGRAFS